MRGQDTQQAGMFSYLSPEERVPATHPLRLSRVTQFSPVWVIENSPPR